MPATYEPIQSYTLGSAAATITFSSIPATYTDLRLILIGTTSASGTMRLRFNSDTATNYSYTDLTGNGSTAASSRGTSTTNINITTGLVSGSSTTIPVVSFVDIFSYAGSTFKTCLISASQDYNGTGTTMQEVGLYRSTTAISTINLLLSTGNYSIGTTATLYGIKNA